MNHCAVVHAQVRERAYAGVRCPRACVWRQTGQWWQGSGADLHVSESRSVSMACSIAHVDVVHLLLRNEIIVGTRRQPTKAVTYLGPTLALVEQPVAGKVPLRPVTLIVARFGRTIRDVHRCKQLQALVCECV